MESTKLQNWLQVFGATAIAASLVFVGLQLKQSQEIAVAAQYQSRHDSASENIRAYIQSETAMRAEGARIILFTEMLGEILPPDFRDWIIAQPPDEVAYRLFQTSLDLMTYDNLHYQNQAGFLSEESWASHRAAFKSGLSLGPPINLYRVSFELSRIQYRSSFQDHVDGLLGDIDAERQSP